MQVSISGKILPHCRFHMNKQVSFVQCKLYGAASPEVKLFLNRQGGYDEMIMYLLSCFSAPAAS